MPRAMIMTLDDVEYDVAPTKVDRRKLYGWTQTVALDDAGRECTLASMDGSGTFVIPPGGTGLGILAPDRSWVDRSGLKAVTTDGQDAPLPPSSYDAPVALTRVVTPDELLDFNITAVYQLADSGELSIALGDRILAFDYVYRAGYTSNQAFVLAADGAAFMLVGYRNDFAYVGLAQAEGVDEEEADEPDADDDIDFSMF